MKKLLKQISLLPLLFFVTVSYAQTGDELTVLDLRDPVLSKFREKTEAAMIVVFGDNLYYSCIGPKINKALKESGFSFTNACETFAGLNYVDQVKVFKTLLYSPANAVVRQDVIDKVFTQVYGRVSTAEEFAFWEQKLTVGKSEWYASMVTKNIGLLNANKELRTKVIEQMYLDVFGRVPTKDDMGFWLPSKDHYNLMHKAGVKFLYAENSVAELAATVKRAFQKKKPNYSDTEFKTLLVDARSFSYSYNQMLKNIK